MMKYGILVLTHELIQIIEYHGLYSNLNMNKKKYFFHKLCILKFNSFLRDLIFTFYNLTIKYISQKYFA